MGEECSICSTAGQAVSLNLVRFHLTHPWGRELEGKQFNFCEAPDCLVVYFSVEGDTFRVDDVRHPPAYKTGRATDQLCFCFNVTGDDVTNADPSPYIRQRVRQGECACNVTNPSGECCLRSVGRWQKQHPRLIAL